MTTLEQRLSDALDTLELPDRDLVTPVLAATTAQTTSPALATPAPPRPSSRRTLAPRLALAAIAIVAATVMILSLPTMRDAVAGWLGIGATQIDLDPGGSLSGISASTAEVLGATPVTTAADPIPLLGKPAGAFDLDAVRGRAFVWPAQPGRPELGDSGVGAILTVRSVEGLVGTKRLPGEVAPIEVQLQLDGHRTTSIWIDDDHEFVPAGSDEPALSGRVLIWTSRPATGDLLEPLLQYRLEANLDQEAMINLAQNVQGGTELLPQE